jgi:hypothetical protein
MARHVELIVRGDDRDLKGYLTGYFSAARPLRFEFADDAGFHISHLRERIRHHGEVQHVIVSETDAHEIHRALDGAAPRYEFEVKETRNIEQVRFLFEFDTPSRKVAKKLKALLDNLPAGTHLENYTFEEETDPGAADTELYAPEHDFKFAGRGEIVGDVFAVIEMRALMAAIDFVRAHEIEVDDL